MVTKYDLLEYLYTRGPLRPQELLRELKKTKQEYATIYQILKKLEKEGMVQRVGREFQSIANEKNKQAHRLITYCMANNMNYNTLLDKGIAKFIKEALPKRTFSARDFTLNPRTFMHYTDTLYRYGFLIVRAKKPFKAYLPYNSFLEDVLSFFGYKRILISKRKEDNYIKDKDIEKEVRLFKRLRRKNEKKYQEIIDTYEINFIQHSLNLEGNPITLPETIKLLKNAIVPKDMQVENVQEVQNYQRAVNQMLSDAAERKMLTKESILSYHRLALQHKPEIAGKMRTIPVFIRGNPNFKVVAPQDIEKRLDELLTKYREFIKGKKSIKETLSFASYFHNEFQHIHPFIDGNSRTTRLLTFHVLRAQDIPIIDIPLGLLEMYVASTKGAKTRDDKQLTSALQSIILYNVRMMNEQLRQ